MATVPAPNTGAGSSLYFLSNIDTLRDPARNTRWRMLIPGTIWSAVGVNPTNGGAFTDTTEGADKFALHIKDCKIPEISVKKGTLNWMGFDSQFPVGQEGLSGNMDIKAILLEDMAAYQSVLAWNQACLNTGILSGTDVLNDPMANTGIKLGLGTHKDGNTENATRGPVIRNTSIQIELYNWMRGEQILVVHLHNAWPSKVSADQLTYQQAGLLNFGFTLTYDRWSVTIPSGYRSGDTGTL